MLWRSLPAVFDLDTSMFAVVGDEGTEERRPLSSFGVSGRVGVSALLPGSSVASTMTLSVLFLAAARLR